MPGNENCRVMFHSKRRMLMLRLFGTGLAVFQALILQRIGNRCRCPAGELICLMVFCRCWQLFLQRADAQGIQPAELPGQLPQRFRQAQPG